MDHGAVERNLRDMFRSLALDRTGGEVREMPGLTIASVGTEFQMFNAAFFSSPVTDLTDLERRVTLASVAFRLRGRAWSLWVCEELVPQDLRRRLPRVCERARLYLSSEMPGMVAERILGAATLQSGLEIRPVADDRSLREFCKIGADCFRVPLVWFHEIFDRTGRLSGAMRAWVGYYENTAVCTAATLDSADVTGLYNLATLAAFRERGFGEAMVRHSLDATWGSVEPKPVVLQSTRQGLRMYERLGFRSVGRILVFPSR